MLDVDIEWVERYDAGCHGRQFGFWVVTAAPYSWGEQVAAYRAAAPACGVAPPPVPCPLWAQIECHDLKRPLLYVLDEGERRWPGTN